MKNTKTNAVKSKGLHAGRPKGSFSFVNVKFATLSNKILDPETVVPISRKYANLLGLGNLKPVSTAQALEPMQVAMESAASSAVSVVDLDAPVSA